MRKPLLRAEGIAIKDRGLSDGDGLMQVLVQCDDRESFYRFPGGGVDFGETAADAIAREWMEEFDLPVIIGPLAAVAETILEYGGRQRHDCTLLHWCELTESLTEELRHNEHPDVKLVWRTVEQLRRRPFYPDGILAFLLSGEAGPIHLRSRRTND